MANRFHQKKPKHFQVSCTQKIPIGLTSVSLFLGHGERAMLRCSAGESRSGNLIAHADFYAAIQLIEEVLGVPNHPSCQHQWPRAALRSAA